MSSPYAFSFTTEPTFQPLRIITTYPCDKATDVSPSTPVHIIFSERMDRDLTESAVIPSPSIDWGAAWKDNDTTLTFTPSSPLENETRYTITIGMGARSINYAHLVAPYTFSFTTRKASGIVPPTVVSTSPPDDATDVDPLSKITITFSEPMDTNATEKAVSMTPGSMVKMEWDADRTTLTVTASLEVRTTYIVTVSTGAKDLAGAAMAESYTFSFTTGHSSILNTAFSLVLSLLVLAIVLTLVLFLMRRMERRMVSRKSAYERRPPPPSTSEKGPKKESDHDRPSSGDPSSSKQPKRS
jgi:hypothetical protein